MFVGFEAVVFALVVVGLDLLEEGGVFEEGRELGFSEESE